MTAPWQPEPAPAVQPKQWRPVLTRRPATWSGPITPIARAKVLFELPLVGGQQIAAIDYMPAEGSPLFRSDRPGAVLSQECQGHGECIRSTQPTWTIAPGACCRRSA